MLPLEKCLMINQLQPEKMKKFRKFHKPALLDICLPSPGDVMMYDQTQVPSHDWQTSAPRSLHQANSHLNI